MNTLLKALSNNHKRKKPNYDQSEDFKERDFKGDFSIKKFHPNLVPLTLELWKQMHVLFALMRKRVRCRVLINSGRQR